MEQMTRAIINLVKEQPWAIQEHYLDLINNILGHRLFDMPIDLKEVEKSLGRPLDNQPQPAVIRRHVAVIPMVGTIAKRMNMFHDISGGLSCELAKRDIQAALQDPEVDAIVLNIDSPGGTVDGTQSLAEFIFQSRGIKPIIAHADGLMASAAYWIGSAAERVTAQDSTTTVGSIGVITAHYDYSKFDEARGIKRTVLYSGRYKAVGKDNAPLSSDDQAVIQKRLDDLYSIFVDSVARNRGAEADQVQSEMADGKIFLAGDAKNVGLIDDIMTLEDCVAMAADMAKPAPVAVGSYKSENFLLNLTNSGPEHLSFLEDLEVGGFTHNSTVDPGEPTWGSVDKTALPRAAFARQGDPAKKSTWGFEHHWVKGGTKKDANGIWMDGTMYLHKGGLGAASSAAEGGRSGQKAEKPVIDHLNGHRRDLKLPLLSYIDHGDGWVTVTGESAEEPIEAPYPNEHACRLMDPAMFDSMRRVNNARNHKGKSYDVIYGIKNGKSQDQAYRYGKDTWTAKEASNHCSMHGGRFEAAQNTKGEGFENTLDSGEYTKEETMKIEELEAKVATLETTVKTQGDEIVKLTAEKQQLDKDLAIERQKTADTEAKAMQLREQKVVDDAVAEILEASGIPAELYDKVKAHVDYKMFRGDTEFLKGSEAYTKFVAAFDAEVKDWEAKLPKGGAGIGLVDGKKTRTGSEEETEASADAKAEAKEVLGRVLPPKKSK